MKDAVILLKSHLSKKGGAEKYTWRIAHALAQKGKQVTLLSNGPVFAPEEMRVVSFPLSPRFSFRFVENFDRCCSDYVKKNPASLVLGLDRNRFQTHLRASNGVHAAYLVHRRAHDGLFKRLSHRLNPLHQNLLSIERESFEHKALNALIANSEMVKREILSFYDVDPHKIKVVHNGVEWQESSLAFNAWRHTKQSLLSQFNLPSSAFHFLFIGHNYQRKGLEPLMRGFSLLKDKEVHLSVIGKEKNCAYFHKLAKQLGIDKRISFFGARSDISSFYQLADSLVIPSFYDPFANVTVEALAMGLFVVSSKANGGHEVLTPNTGVAIGELSQTESVHACLQQALKRPKTWKSSVEIRESVRALDFSKQLELLLSHCL
jgi:UDP-glucose:(heptosyl)LPS alpha-1,3-glucosyltransferase